MVNSLVFSLDTPVIQMPRWLSQSIILPQKPAQSQVRPLRPKNENFLYPSFKETLSPVIFGKIGGPQ